MMPAGGVSWVAIAALVLSLVSFGWQVVHALRDRGRLSLAVVPLNIVTVLEGVIGRCLALDVTNVGRRHCYVAGVAVKFDDGTEGDVLLPHAARLPKRLEPGEWWRIRVEDGGCLAPRVARVFVCDTIGGRFYCPPKVLADAKAQWAKMQADKAENGA